MKRVIRDLGTLHVIITAAITIPILATTLLVVLGVAAPIFQAISVAGPGGTDGGSIAFGTAVKLMGSAGMLSIVGAVALKMLVGGEPPERPP